MHAGDCSIHVNRMRKSRASESLNHLGSNALNTAVFSYGQFLSLSANAAYKFIYGTVSAKIAPRSKCYKNASRLNRCNFPTDNAIDFLFSTLHSKMV